SAVQRVERAEAEEARRRSAADAGSYAPEAKKFPADRSATRAPARPPSGRRQTPSVFRTYICAEVPRGAGAILANKEPPEPTRGRAFPHRTATIRERLRPSDPFHRLNVGWRRARRPARRASTFP